MMLKTWIAIVTCVPLLVGCAVTQKPTISFVRFRPGQGSAIAVFRMSNSAAQPLTFLGNRPAEPLYLLGVPTGSGRQVYAGNFLPWAVPTVPASLVLEPGAAIEFEVSPKEAHAYYPSAAVDVGRRFQVGIDFERGTPEESVKRWLRSQRFRQLNARYPGRTDSVPYVSEINLQRVWSAVVSASPNQPPNKSAAGKRGIRVLFHARRPSPALPERRR
jgi:hypothetical protein